MRCQVEPAMCRVLWDFDRQAGVLYKRATPKLLCSIPIRLVSNIFDIVVAWRYWRTSSVVGIPCVVVKCAGVVSRELPVFIKALVMASAGEMPQAQSRHLWAALVEADD